MSGLAAAPHGAHADASVFAGILSPACQSSVLVREENIPHGMGHETHVRSNVEVEKLSPYHRLASSTGDMPRSNVPTLRPSVFSSPGQGSQNTRPRCNTSEASLSPANATNGTTDEVAIEWHNSPCYTESTRSISSSQTTANTPPHNRADGKPSLSGASSAASLRKSPRSTPNEEDTQSPRASSFDNYKRFKRVHDENVSAGTTTFASGNQVPSYNSVKHLTPQESAIIILSPILERSPTEPLDRKMAPSKGPLSSAADDVSLLSAGALLSEDCSMSRMSVVAPPLQAPVITAGIPRHPKRAVPVQSAVTASTGSPISPADYRPGRAVKPPRSTSRPESGSRDSTTVVHGNRALQSHKSSGTHASAYKLTPAKNSAPSKCSVTYEEKVKKRTAEIQKPTHGREILARSQGPHTSAAGFFPPISSYTVLLRSSILDGRQWPSAQKAHQNPFSSCSTNTQMHPETKDAPSRREPSSNSKPVARAPSAKRDRVSRQRSGSHSARSDTSPNITRRTITRAASLSSRSGSNATKELTPQTRVRTDVHTGPQTSRIAMNPQYKGVARVRPPNRPAVPFHRSAFSALTPSDAHVHTAGVSRATGKKPM